MTLFMTYGPTHVTRNVTQNTRPSSTFQEGPATRLDSDYDLPEAQYIRCILAVATCWQKKNAVEPYAWTWTAS